VREKAGVGVAPGVGRGPKGEAEGSNPADPPRSTVNSISAGRNRRNLRGMGWPLTTSSAFRWLRQPATPATTPSTMVGIESHLDALYGRIPLAVSRLGIDQARFSRNTGPYLRVTCVESSDGGSIQWIFHLIRLQRGSRGRPGGSRCKGWQGPDPAATPATRPSSSTKTSRARRRAWTEAGRDEKASSGTARSITVKG